MTHTVVGFFEDRDRALQAQSEIIRMGIVQSDIYLFDQSASERTGDEGPGWWTGLKEAFGFGSDERNLYQEGLTRGGTLLSVRADESNVERVADILDRSGAIDIDERAAEWTSTGATAGIPNTPSASTTAVPSQQGRQGSIPIVEEELKVGKRAVRRGGVRVYRQVIEQPVEETIRLRDETVHVDRTPVNRPATAEPGLFENQTIEMAEIDEEPVVSKEARVVEEVSLRKDVSERAETIRDTVRRSDVQVEPLSGERNTSPQAWNDEEARQHWSTHYSAAGRGYDEYDPAYRYGSQLAGGYNQDSSDWTQLEPEARRSWEAEHQGTWEHMKDAVRYGWERAKGKASVSERRAA